MNENMRENRSSINNKNTFTRKFLFTKNVVDILCKLEIDNLTCQLVLNEVFLAL